MFRAFFPIGFSVAIIALSSASAQSTNAQPKQPADLECDPQFVGDAAQLEPLPAPKLSVPPAPTEPLNISGALPSPAPSSMSRGLRRMEKQQQFERIQSALKRLKSDWKSDRPATASESRTAAIDRSEEFGVPHRDLEPPQPPAWPENLAAEVDQNQNSTATADSTDVDPGVSTDEDASSLFGLEGVAVVDGPVDRVALADNFYAEKEFAIALRMYGEVKLKDLSVDQQYWVQFQQASCLRRLGDRDAARKVYRILAGRKDGGWLAGMSTWWLFRMDERAELEQQINLIETRLAELKESEDESENL